MYVTLDVPAKTESERECCTAKNRGMNGGRNALNAYPSEAEAVLDFCIR